MEKEHSKIGELYKRAFEGYQEQPSPAVWEKIAQNPVLKPVTPAKNPFRGNPWIQGITLTAVVGGIFLITHLFRQDDEKLRPETPSMQQEQLTGDQAGSQPAGTDLIEPAAGKQTAHLSKESAPGSTQVQNEPADGAVNPGYQSAINHGKTVKPVLKQIQDLPVASTAPRTMIQAAVKTTPAATTQQAVNPSPAQPAIPLPEPKIKVDVIEDQVVCNGESITIWASGGTTYYWNTGEETPSITVQPTVTTTYYVTVTTHAGTPTQESILVTVIDCEELHIPNAFTPNNDSKNDKFLVYGNHVTDFNMIILSRTGQIIFETRDIQEGWDGTIKGSPAEMGVYVYRITYTDNNGKEHTRTGQLTLLK